MVAIFKMDVIENLISDKFPEITVLEIEGKHFVFDKESLNEFNEYFADDFHIIFLDNGYLCRRPKWDKDINLKNFKYFHRFLMDNELSEKGQDFQVNHLTWCKRINIKKYLIVVPKDVHDRLHEKRLRDRNLMKQSKWIEFDD